MSRRSTYLNSTLLRTSLYCLLLVKDLGSPSSRPWLAARLLSGLPLVARTMHSQTANLVGAFHLLIFATPWLAPSIHHPRTGRVSPLECSHASVLLRSKFGLRKPSRCCTSRL